MTLESLKEKKDKVLRNKANNKNIRRNVFIYIICLSVIIITHLNPPGGLEPNGYKMLGICITAAILWSTEACPVPITALLIIFLQAVFGITSLNNALGYIGHPVNALIFVGFSLSAGLIKYRIDRKISIQVIKLAGTNVKKLLLYIMAAVAFLSMWMSNTSTTAVMVPIVVGILKMTEGNYKNLGKVFVLAIAYAGTIGGMATPVGTPPNPITMGFLQEMAGISLTFLDWMLIGLPFVVLLIPLAWMLLLLLFPPEVKEVTLSSVEGLDSFEFTNTEKVGAVKFFACFALLIILWIGGSFFPVPNNWLYIVSLGGSILLYLPVVGVLNWEDTKNNVNWGAMIVIGGGLAMGSGLSQSGLIDWVIELFMVFIQDMPLFLIVVMLGGLTGISIIFFCSITATSTAFVPLAIALAFQIEADPVLLGAAAGIASSFAYILPANTPPNAIAYSTGLFKTNDMIKAGFLLLLISLMVFTLISQTVWKFIF